MGLWAKQGTGQPDPGSAGDILSKTVRIFPSGPQQRSADTKTPEYLADRTQGA